MSNAYGGIVNITFIVVFIVIVSGYLAFSVSYNKAFRVKNKIISTIEECEGLTPKAEEKIKEYMKEIGYNMASDWKIDSISGKKAVCPSGQGYCYYAEDIENSNELGIKKVFFVTTAVNIDMPILNKILPNMKIFQVSGSTKTITCLSNDCT